MALTKEALAEKLNGMEYGDEIDTVLLKDAKAFRLLIVYGASDDLMEFDGFESDELNAYNGTTAHVDFLGLLPERNSFEGDGSDDAELHNFFHRRERSKPIKAVWHDIGPVSWTFDTDIPHATFDILEDGRVYCRGIVIFLGDLE